MRCRYAALISPEKAKTIELSKRERIRTVKDEMPWNENTYLLHEFGLTREALEINLSIFWAKVDERRRVNDDPAKNTFAECWLEFGQVKYAVSDGHLDLMHYHDPRLDCGAPTFDQAIVKLARLVRKHYGDYKAPKWMTG
jgi:hypothetical protein